MRSSIPNTRLRAVAAALACAIALPAGGAAAQDFRYDAEYPGLEYSGEARANPVAELIADLDAGRTELVWGPEHGYLDSLLAALEIDVSSQTLVYSKTSLQYPLISSETPRALYFNDTVYIGWVQNSDIVEIAAMDAELGPVFYVFHNEREKGARFGRETGRCLTCHDTQGMMGGGTPALPVRSTLVRRSGAPLSVETSTLTTDRTPLSERWGGWYVTGRHGGQVHMGNVLIEKSAELEGARLGNLDSLHDLFDAEPYLAATSDIVALMVMEHQVEAQNQIAYVQFKGPAVLERTGMAEAAHAETWEAVPERAKTYLEPMLDELVRLLTFDGAIALDEPVAGGSGFDVWFQGRGPADAQGRSLRTLNLETRLFEYPVSYVVQSAAFDALPGFARDYVYRRIAADLDAREGAQEGAMDGRAAQAALEILSETQPEFAPYAEG